MTTATALTVALKEESRRLGFDLAGATPAVVPPDFDRFQRWITRGNAGEMNYLVNRRDAYRDPHAILPEAKSILMLATNYRTVEPQEPAAGQAKVSRYAWGTDYHETIRNRLHRLADFHRRLTPKAVVRGVVDTAPLLERSFGRQAGLGWIGKNTMLINPELGSWFFLAALLTTEELAYDGPIADDRCGSCHACIDACPTGAIVEPHCLDARKCISYLTIELRGEMPEALQRSCGNRLFGCDACQEACPWNRRTPSTSELSFQPIAGMNPVSLAEITSLDDDSFRRRFRHTPLWRSRREGILRNAANIER